MMQRVGEEEAQCCDLGATLATLPLAPVCDEVGALAMTRAIPDPARRQEARKYRARADGLDALSDGRRLPHVREARELGVGRVLPVRRLGGGERLGECGGRGRVSPCGSRRRPAALPWSPLRSEWGRGVFIARPWWRVEEELDSKWVCARRGWSDTSVRGAGTGRPSRQL